MREHVIWLLYLSYTPSGPFSISVWAPRGRSRLYFIAEFVLLTLASMVAMMLHCSNLSRDFAARYRVG
jgi:drug/metabolite transporter superfamily protein YnfA